MTLASGQNMVGYPAIAKSRLICISSTILLLARETDRIIDQGKAMPVPVSNDGYPNCFNPLGRTKFLTKNAKAEMESFGVGFGGCSIK